jgi:hypothetical protein
MIKTQNFQRNGKKFLGNGIPVAIAWTTSVDRGLAAANPWARGGRLYRGSRAEKIWTDADEAMFLERAPAHLHLALMLALWTGQRQGDLLRLEPCASRRSLSKNFRILASFCKLCNQKRCKPSNTAKDCSFIVDQSDGEFRASSKA